MKSPEQKAINTAKQILMQKAERAHDGFMTGQMQWVLEAMYEFAKQEKDMAYEMGYKDGQRDEHKTAMEEIEKYRHS